MASRWRLPGRRRSDRRTAQRRTTGPTRGAAARRRLTVEQFLTRGVDATTSTRTATIDRTPLPVVIENYIIPSVGAHRLVSSFAPTISTACTHDLLDHGGRHGDAPSAQDGLRRSRRDALVAAVRRRPSPRRPQRRRRRSTTTNLDAITAQPGDLDRPATRRTSSLTPHTSGSTPRFISPRRLGCVEARSPGCDGATGTSTRTDSRSRAADRASRAAPSKSQPRPQQADGPSISTPTPNKSSPDGVAGNNATGNPSESTIRSSRTEHGEPVNPESISQLFDRKTLSSGLPRIRLHDLRHTHASLLVAAGEPIKVVSERLGHAHPGFTMATYQHLLPGMGAAAATNFAALLATASGQCEPAGPTRRRVAVGRRSTGSASRTPRSTTWTSREPVDDLGRRTSEPKMRNARKRNVSGHFIEWRGQDLNLRPSGYEPVRAFRQRLVELHSACSDPDSE